MPEHYDLETFRTRKFDYGAGHHVGIFGPTQIAGKTTLAYALLEAVLLMPGAGSYQPEINATTFCMKHQDRVIAHWTGRLGFREIQAFAPPRAPLFGQKPPGQTLWPHQSLSDPIGDNELLQREFVKGVVWNRLHTPSISHLNELYGLLAELSKPKDRQGRPMVPMRPLLVAVVTRDSVAGHGAWYESQKASGTQGHPIDGFFFNSAEHMFLSKDGVKANRQRYADIACGIDPESIERETLKLEKHSWLYIRRSGPEWAVVDAYDSALAI